jgi:inorganic pyrophosphatase
MQLHKLPARDDDGDVRVVVEAPRGSGLKLKYEPSLRAFEHGRMLPLGLTYPYDWGFVPGTKAEDGDPLDALVITDVPSWPGVVIPCRPLGAVLVEDEEDGEKERNDRLVLVPSGADRFDHLTNPESLPHRMREEIEQFFLNTIFFTPKNAKILGWKGPKYADKLIARAENGRKKE